MLATRRPDLVDVIQGIAGNASRSKMPQASGAFYPLLPNSVGGVTSGGQLIVDAVDAGNIRADAVQAYHIDVVDLSAINADLGTITAGTITGGTIRTSATNPKVQMDPTGLFAKNVGGSDTFRIDAATGNVTIGSGATFTGGSFTGGTFTGGTFRTSASNPKVQLDTTGLFAKDSGGTDTFRIDATTGAVTATGITVTGGTFTGGTFRTSASNPKVQLDSTGLFAKNAGGTDTFRIDSSTGAVTGTGTFTGGTFQTAASGARVLMDSTGLHAYDASAVEKLRFDIATGSLTLAGILTAQSGSAVPITYVTTGNIVSGTVFTIQSGGYLQTAASNPRVVLDNAGLRAYNASGVLVADVNASAASFTGATFQTAASGARVVMDSAGLRFIDSAGNPSVELSSSAAGLRLLTNDTGVPLNARMIRWADPTTGVDVTRLISTMVGAGQGTTNLLSNGWGVLGADILIDAQWSPTAGALYTADAYLILHAQGTSDQSVKIGVGGVQKLVIDQASKSDFLLVRPKVTAFPTTNLYDGMTYEIQAASDVTWRFRYNASGGTYKWEFVGGPPLEVHVATDESTNSTAYTSTGFTAMSINLPLAGDFDIEVQGTGYSATAANINAMSFSVGATAAVDADAARSDSTFAASASKKTRKTGLASGAAITARYRNGAVGGGVGHWFDRRLLILPVRCSN